MKFFPPETTQSVLRPFYKMELCKSKELLTAEGAEFAESIDFIDSFLCALSVLCGYKMLLHSSVSEIPHFSFTYASAKCNRGSLALEIPDKGFREWHVNNMVR